MTKLILPLVCIWLFSQLLVGSVWAAEYYFQEEFNVERPSNTLDLTKWTIYSNSGSFPAVKETQGNLSLTQQNNTRDFPYIVSKNAVLPDGDFSAEVKFQYTKVTFWGTGIALADSPPANRVEPTNLLTISVWQDKSVGPHMRIQFDGDIVYTAPVNTATHILKVQRIAKKYKVYLDDQLIFTSPDTDIQVRYVWMGNPVLQSSGVPEWTTFKVDYIRSKILPPSKTPLILIPGIGGSEFKSNQTFITNIKDCGILPGYTYNSNDTVWVNTTVAAISQCDDYFDVLKLKTDGQTPEYSQIVLNGNLFQGAYGELIKFFTDNGYELNKTLFLFPYDWRKDITHTAPLLDQKIQEIKQQTGSEKVDIVAHSMGGLVARNYIADASKAQNVRKLFSIGTPHLGAVKSLKALVYGDCLTDARLKDFPYCIGINSEEMKDVIQNLITNFQLIPSQRYFNFYSGEDSIHPYPYRNNNEALNYEKIKSLLAVLDYNVSLFAPAETFHNLDNTLQNTNGVDVTVIAGSGLPTLGQIIETTSTSLLGIKSTQREIININGDNTVPLFSASLTDTSKNLSLLGHAKIFYTKQQHGSLVSPGPALNLVKNILNDDINLPSGVSTQAYQFNGTQLSVHSPVNIHVYDQNGNHTGPISNGGFEINIPGSSYDTLDDAKFIFLPDNGTYTVRFEATDQGSFDFKIRSFQNDINNKTILYKDIPLAKETKAETIVNTDSPEPPTLKVDVDGDGVTDSNISSFSTISGNANYDFTPPVISADINPKSIWPPNGKLVNVNIKGTINDQNPYLYKILVEDEYGQVEPTLTIYHQSTINQTIKLEASRKGDDKDGRKYTIKIIAVDLSGNTSMHTAEAIIAHDQNKK